MMLTSAAQTAARAGGATLAAAAHGLGVWRRPAKPLHPSGRFFTGRLRRHGAGDEHPTGVPWLDEPGEDDVRVRLSRAVGLPDILPDIHGLAVRVALPGGQGDLLFASTGMGRITRHLLTPSRHPGGRPMTTLLPYRTRTGPVVLAAETVDDRTFGLSWARGGGAWHRFGTLELEADHGDDDGHPRIWFDPVLNQVPGLGQYAAVRRLREPAYRRARRTRDDVART
jgi:hypothetical protein